MAATKSQGRNFTLFMVGLTAVCAGIAFFDSGIAKVVLVVGAIVLAVASGGSSRSSPLKARLGGRTTSGHEIDRRCSGAGGLAICAPRIAPDCRRGSRMVTSIIGLRHFDRRNLFVLVPAVNKNAIWKA